MGRDFEDDDDDYDDDEDDRPSRRRSRRRDDDDEIDVSESLRMPAGICGILIGGLGVHKFILGYGLEGGLLLGLTIAGILIGTIGAIGGAFCCIPFVLMIFYVAPMASGTIGLIEGIIYLTKTDEEFIEVYQHGHRTWF
jgi:hypothetical protein